jgi:hypothetical protein
MAGVSAQFLCNFNMNWFSNGQNEALVSFLQEYCKSTEGVANEMLVRKKA